MKATAPLRPPARPATPPPARDAPRRTARPARPSQKRAVLWGLGISAAIHLLFLILASRTWFVPEFAATRATPASPRDGAARDVMQVYRIVPRSDPEVVDALPPVRRETTPVEPVGPEPVRPPARPEATPDRPGGEATPDAATAPETMTPADLLRPRLGDRRLWDVPAPPERSDIDRARDRIYGRLGELNDSLAAEAEAARRATDWTVAGKDGKRWGISPGKLHLGDVTLPLPVTFSPTPEARARAARDAEIAGQAERTRVGESFKDRVKAIRERKEQERAAKAKPGSGASSD